MVHHQGQRSQSTRTLHWYGYTYLNPEGFKRKYIHQNKNYIVNAKKCKRQTSKIIWRYINLKGRRYSIGDGKANYGVKEQLVIVKGLDQMKDVYLLSKRKCGDSVRISLSQGGGDR